MSIFGTNKPSIYPTTGAINISSVSYSGGLTQINTASAHSLTAGDGVLIQSVSGTTILNKSWKVYSVIDADSFTIVNDTIETPTGGNITKGIYLNNSQINYSFVEPEQLNYRSVINGNRTNTHLGDYGTFKVIVRCWQASSAKTLFQAIYVYYHTNVIFCPHNLPTKLSSTVINCYLKEMRPFYWKNLISYDAVELTFETNKYYDVTTLLI